MLMLAGHAVRAAKDAWFQQKASEVVRGRESGMAMHQGHLEREEMASAGREWQLLYNHRGPTREMKEALQYNTQHPK